MAKEICISSTPHETRLAILEDDQLAEIYYERENEYTLAGSVYKGRVTRVLPGMQSAFVDVGLERDAFLYVTDFLEEQEEDSADFERSDSGGNGRRAREPREQREPREAREPRRSSSRFSGGRSRSLRIRGPTPQRPRQRPPRSRVRPRSGSWRAGRRRRHSPLAWPSRPPFPRTWPPLRTKLARISRDRRGSDFGRTRLPS